jgi:hypothetical protein
MATLEIDGGKIKPSGYKQDYTFHEAKELARCTIDPVYFIEKYVKLKHPKHGALPFVMYDFQKRLIQTYMGNRKNIAMLSRQCGKTATAAAYLLWWCIFKDNQFVLVASKDQGGADEIMERLWFAYEELPWFLKPGVKKNDVKTKIFDNGSKIITKATTPTAGRGLSVSLLYLDEFAFVRSNWAEKFWTSISPTLATGGSCIITSTPSTDEDKFAKIWFNATPSALSDKWEDKLAKRYAALTADDEQYETIYETDEIAEKMEMLSATVLDDDDDDEEDGFTSFHAHWTSVPDQLDKTGKILSYRGEKFKRGQLKSGVTPEDWMREFECCFISGENTLISGAKLAVFRSTVKDPRFVDKWGCRWYEPILPNTPYAVILDPSGDGTNGDDAAIQVWELPIMRQVAEWNDAESDQDEQARMLYRVLNRVHKLQENDPDHDGVNNIYYSVERNAIGIGIIRAIEHMGEEKFPGWLIDSSEVSRTPRGETVRSETVSRYRGLLTTPSTKRRYSQDLKQFIERNLFIVRSKFLSTQLKNFVKTGPGWAAKNGKDDIVMSCVLMCHLIDELRYQEPELDDYVRPIIEEYDENDVTHPDNQAVIPIL